MVLLLAVGAVGLCGFSAATKPLEPGRLAGFIDLFSPVPKGPDYVLNLEVYQGSRLDNQMVIKRHGDWFGIGDRHRNGLTLRNIHAPSATIIDRSDDLAGVATFLSVRAPDRDSDRTDYASRRTGKMQTVIGQRCEVWDVYRGIANGAPTWARFGCVTGDGIELSRWTVSSSGDDLGFGAVATALTRRKVAPAEVRPASLRLDLSPWFSGGRDGGGKSSEVVLKADGAGSETLILRKRGGWSYTETLRDDGARDYFIRNEAGVLIRARIGKGGAPQSLTAERPSTQLALPEVQSDGTETETVLGRKCTWVDAAPHVHDIGRNECRTADGLVLIVEQYSRGHPYSRIVAVSISDRPLTDAEMLPPAWLLDLRRWGVTLKG